MKERQSNIELCRIFAIFCIVFSHSLSPFLFGGGAARPDCWWMAVMGHISTMGVNTFILIAGYFSVKSKKTAYLNLLYICFFYLLVRLAICAFTGVRPTLNMFLFVSRSSWFIPMYIGLLLLSPMLNGYIDNIDKKTLTMMVVALLVFDFWSDWIPGGVNNRSGFNVMHFIAMYFVGRYLKLCGIKNSLVRFAPVVWLSLLAVISAAVYYIIYKGLDANLLLKLIAFNNPLIIVASIALFLSFTRIDLGSNRVINHCAKSVLGILLLHECTVSRIVLSRNYDFCFNHYSGITLFLVWLTCVLVTVLAGILIDQVRIFSYGKIQKIFSK